MSYSVDNDNYIPNEFKKYNPKSISIKPNIVDIHVGITCMNYYKYIPMYYECEYIYNIPNSKVIVTTFKFYDESELFEMLDKALEINKLIYEIHFTENKMKSILEIFNCKNKEYNMLKYKKQILYCKLKSINCIKKFEQDFIDDNYNIELINM